ncbi:hypothetical protein BT67DRAFT_11041 [Trichocladium antarcticum]|uniref:Uncharacterized protein n=1 Tax=Trichocladium antarcticum TaxID=1450529 RepID=A0AAN6ZI72_9PEZI|nr:hypothetical protein BT67DRAFT_11041 [Trichocladium antarcticum]
MAGDAKGLTRATKLGTLKLGSLGRPGGASFNTPPARHAPSCSMFHAPTSSSSPGHLSNTYVLFRPTLAGFWIPSRRHNKRQPAGPGRLREGPRRSAACREGRGPHRAVAGAACRAREGLRRDRNSPDGATRPDRPRHPTPPQRQEPRGGRGPPGGACPARLCRRRRQRPRQRNHQQNAAQHGPGDRQQQAADRDGRRD